jgi:hypothetical protein
MLWNYNNVSESDVEYISMMGNVRITLQFGVFEHYA